MIPALSCHRVTLNDSNISCSKDTNVHAQFDSSWLTYQNGVQFVQWLKLSSFIVPEDIISIQLLKLL